MHMTEGVQKKGGKRFESEAGQWRTQHFRKGGGARLLNLSSLGGSGDLFPKKYFIPMSTQDQFR